MSDGLRKYLYVFRSPLQMVSRNPRARHIHCHIFYRHSHHATAIFYLFRHNKNTWCIHLDYSQSILFHRNVCMVQGLLCMRLQSKSVVVHIRIGILYKDKDSRLPVFGEYYHLWFCKLIVKLMSLPKQQEWLLRPFFSFYFSYKKLCRYPAATPVQMLART